MAAVDLDTALQAALTCVCEALAAAGRPVCECYAVIGDPIIAFCCECPTPTPGVTATGEATINLERVFDADPETLTDVTPRIQGCRRGTVAAEAEIVITRCYPTVNEQGEMPSAFDQDQAATDLHGDVSTVWRALACCDTVRIATQDIRVDAAPEAGCSALSARIVVEVRP